MLRLRLTTEAQPRRKNGAPAHSTTGVAKASWIPFVARSPSIWCRPSQGRWPPMSSRNTGAVSTSPIQKRRVMSASSGSGPIAAAGSSGSSAMPQIGQAPGPSRRISGCIGQVYSAPSGGGGTLVGLRRQIAFGVGGELRFAAGGAEESSDGRGDRGGAASWRDQPASGTPGRSPGHRQMRTAGSGAWWCGCPCACWCIAAC